MEDVGQSERCHRIFFSFFLAVACHNRRKRVWPTAKKGHKKEENEKTGDAQSHFRLPRPLTSKCNLGHQKKPL